MDRIYWTCLIYSPIYGMRGKAGWCRHCLHQLVLDEMEALPHPPVMMLKMSGEWGYGNGCTSKGLIVSNKIVIHMFFSIHNTRFKQHCTRVSLLLTFIVKRKFFWIIIAYLFCFRYCTSYCLQLMLFYSFIYLLF